MVLTGNVFAIDVSQGLQANYASNTDTANVFS